MNLEGSLIKISIDEDIVEVIMDVELPSDTLETKLETLKQEFGVTNWTETDEGEYQANGNGNVTYNPGINQVRHEISLYKARQMYRGAQNNSIAWKVGGWIDRYDMT